MVGIYNPHEQNKITMHVWFKLKKYDYLRDLSIDDK